MAVADPLMIEISRCEVCGSAELQPVLDLGRHALADDMVPIGNAARCAEYPIEILYCETCRTAHQRFQVQNTVLFPQTYHYRARFTADVLSGMKALVEAVEAAFGSLSQKIVLDIGCNDGSLLNFFRDRGAKTVGIEPTGAAQDAEESGHAIVNGYLSPQAAQAVLDRYGKPDVITFTNVFAHISDLNGVLDSLRVLMTPNTLLVIENHYLGSVLKGRQFDTFYHEHPRTYSLSSFEFIASSLGLAAIKSEFPSRYGGNIRVFIGRPDLIPGAPKAKVDESEFKQRFGALRTFVDEWRESKGRQIAELVAKYGPLPAKAFPARAAILVKLLGLDIDSIHAIYERPGSKKIGNYAPGTRIPILSETELYHTEGRAPLVNLAWHISDEIHQYMRSNGYRGEIIDILDQP